MNSFYFEIINFITSIATETTSGEILGFCFIREKNECFIPVGSESYRSMTPCKATQIREQLFPCKVHFIYEDLWKGKNLIIKGRIIAALGQGRKIFARNCACRKIEAPKAKAFLEKNHIYGSTKADIYMGLFRRVKTSASETQMDVTPELVAVASFSKGSVKDDSCITYNFERYASLTGTNVIGAMGKITEGFIRICKITPPFNIMTYSDREWSEGDSYDAMGFTREGSVPGILFFIDSSSGRRIHAEKIGRDKALKGLHIDEENTFFNIGSNIHIKRYR